MVKLKVEEEVVEKVTIEAEVVWEVVEVVKVEKEGE